LHRTQARHAEEVLDVVLPADDQPTKVMRPGKESFHYLVWFGILNDNQMLENEFNPLAERSRQSLSATGLIRATPELVVLDPTPRSRLRWLP
jgi:hypothetical protein